MADYLVSDAPILYRWHPHRQSGKPFKWMLEEFDSLRFRIGNRLLRMSDEVKDGTIQNECFIRNLTATEAYIHLEMEQQSKQK